MDQNKTRMINIWTVMLSRCVVFFRHSGFIFPVSMLGLLLFFVTCFSVVFIYQLQVSMAHAIKENVASMSAGLRLELHVRELMAYFNRYLITGNSEYFKQIYLLKEKVNFALDDVERLALTDNEKVLADKIRSGISQFFVEYSHQVESKDHFNYSLVVKAVDKILFSEIQEPVSSYIRLNEQMMEKTLEKNQKTSRIVNGMIVVVGLGGATIGTATGILVTTGLFRSKRKTEAILKSAAKTLKNAVEPLSFVNDQPGNITDCVIMARKVIARLKKSEADALHAEKLAFVGQMAAGIAHEIRNPLMTVKLLIQNASMHEVNGEFARLEKADLVVLEEEILRIEKIISGILDFAKPSHPKVKPIRLNEFICKCLSSIELRAKKQGVGIEYCKSTDDAYLLIDPEQMTLAFVNFLINSLDAMPDGGIIKINHEVKSGELNTTVIISDTGIGICKSISDRLFEPFVSSKDFGLGLGLSIARRIIEIQGGNVSLVLNPGQVGATFALCLPSSKISRTIL